jgi:hypothetical protein
VWEWRDIARAQTADVIAKLNAATVQALADPAVKARFAQLGLDVAARDQQTPEGLAAFSERRDGQVVADHQGGGYSRRIIPFSPCGSDDPFL